MYVAERSGIWIQISSTLFCRVYFKINSFSNEAPCGFFAQKLSNAKHRNFHCCAPVTVNLPSRTRNRLEWAPCWQHGAHSSLFLVLNGKFTIVMIFPMAQIMITSQIMNGNYKTNSTHQLNFCYANNNTLQTKTWSLFYSNGARIMLCHYDFQTNKNTSDLAAVNLIKFEIGLSYICLYCHSYQCDHNEIVNSIKYHYRDHFVHAPSQWEMTLHGNIVSHWLGAYTKHISGSHWLQWEVY